MEEVFFDDGTFPPCQETLRAAAEVAHNAEDRLAPFGAGTPPSVRYTTTNYGQLLDNWFAKLMCEEAVPNQEQLSVLTRVRERAMGEL